MSTFDHEQLDGLVAPWVLGALEPDEAERLASHVEGCASCRETAERLRRVVGALPLAADDVAPPDRLRARVLAAAGASRPTTAPASGRRPLRLPRSRRPSFQAWGGRVPAYAAAAAVAVALMLGLVAGELSPRAPAPASQVARFTLSGHQDLSGAQASVVDLKSDGVAFVDFSRLPALQAGRVYELWLITPKGMADPAGVFVPDANGGKVVVVSRSLAGYSQMAVTNEAGPDGTQAPTQQPQLYGNVA